MSGKKMGQKLSDLTGDTDDQHSRSMEIRNQYSQSFDTPCKASILINTLVPISLSPSKHPFCLFPSVLGILLSRDALLPVLTILLQGVLPPWVLNFAAFHKVHY